MWCEEELRDILPKPPMARTGARSLATGLRRSIIECNHVRAEMHPHELTRGAMPSVIYAPHDEHHGNFIDASYQRIQALPEWSRRLRKVHTSKRQASRTGADEETRLWSELDTAISSDALLMNVFCYPRVLATRALPALLGVARGETPEFGYIPRVCRVRSLLDRTEVDMRVGHLLVEAKLTESDFQFAPMRLLERYVRFDEVFDRNALEVTARGVRSYQLIRGVLAADTPSNGAQESAGFCVLADARRVDLIEAWYAVMRAVRPYDLRARLRLLTWQEVAVTLPLPLKQFLREKYGIV